MKNTSFKLSDAQIRHLEMIQAVISRLAQNSFTLKGWAITILAALLALGGNLAGQVHSLLAILVVLVFWRLDAYFLGQERLFRGLYNRIRLLDSKKWEQTPFEMRLVAEDNLETVAFSITLFWFYGSLLLVTIFVAGYIYKISV